MSQINNKNKNTFDQIKQMKSELQKHSKLLKNYQERLQQQKLQHDKNAIQIKICMDKSLRTEESLCDQSVISYNTMSTLQSQSSYSQSVQNNPYLCKPSMYKILTILNNQHMTKQSLYDILISSKQFDNDLLQKSPRTGSDLREKNKLN